MRMLHLYFTGLMFSMPLRNRSDPISGISARISMSSETISPTAHYPGYVWFAHGCSHRAFATQTGRLMYTALRPPTAAAAVLALPSLDGILLARHRLIDLRLTK